MTTAHLRPRPRRLWPLALGAVVRLAIAVGLFAAIVQLAVILAARADTLALVAELAVGVPLYASAYESAVAHARRVRATLRAERRHREAARAADDDTGVIPVVQPLDRPTALMPAVPAK